MLSPLRRVNGLAQVATSFSSLYWVAESALKAPHDRYHILLRHVTVLTGASPSIQLGHLVLDRVLCFEFCSHVLTTSNRVILLLDLDMSIGRPLSIQNLLARILISCKRIQKSLTCLNSVDRQGGMHDLIDALGAGQLNGHGHIRARLEKRRF